MKRVLLKVAYDGTNYHGWQVQDGSATIESELNRAINEITHEQIEVSGASRTDAGVHARGNLAVFDTNARMPAEKFSYALNTRLPEDIRVVESSEVSMEFHPRFVDTEKTYMYRICNAEFPDPLKRLYTFFSYTKYDVDKMQKAAEYLTGEHDFKSFASIHTQAKTTVREITGIKVERADNEIQITVKGYGFLYNMVRIIAGTLLEIGAGKYAPESIKDILEACDRSKAGPTAPAQGLTLIEIKILDGTV
ncbi:MAG: tRNA pseudouridine(38-40) synthase TruA [Lachnospiraceae bacterium]|nr:tRNA pseudouridine(38-40) synthase TruA [Lachnospiraceae bacterium]